MKRSIRSYPRRRGSMYALSIMLLLMLLQLRPLTLCAAEAAGSGSCGEQATWSYDQVSMTLTIGGSGAVSESPWSAYYTEIEKIVIMDGITSIGRGVLSDCTKVTSITIPDSVTSIGAYAFEYCSSIHDITIPDSVTDLGTLAFYGCSKLQSVHLSDNLDSVPDLFYHCSNLVSCNIPAKAKTIKYGAFRNIPLEKVALPEGLEVIEADAFSGTNIDKVSFPSSLRVIGDSAFRDTKIKQLTVPMSVESIGNEAFADTPFVNNYSSDFVTVGNGFLVSYKGTEEAVTIPSDVRVICSGTFANNNTLKKACLPASVVRIDASAFANCQALESVEAKDSLEEIGKEAFAGSLFSKKEGPVILGSVFYCYNGDVEEYVVPSHVVSLAPQSFFCHTELKKISLPEKLKRIGDYAFLGCTGLNWMDVPASVDTIGDHAIGYKLSNGTYGDFYSQPILIRNRGSEKVKNYADDNYPVKYYNPEADNRYGENLAWTLDPETGQLTISGTGPMKDYNNSSSVPYYDLRDYISSIRMEEGVSSIGKFAFYSCEKVKEMVIPDGVTTVSNYALPSGQRLAKIHIGSGLQYSSSLLNSLISCASLKEITVSEDNTSLLASDGVLFNKKGTILYLYPAGMKDKKTYTIPSSVVDSVSVERIGDYAFYYNANLNKIIVPDSVREIGSRSFYNCKSLSKLYFDGNAPTVSSYSYSFGTNNLTIYCHKDTCSGWTTLESRYTSNYETVWEDLDTQSTDTLSITTAPGPINAGSFARIEAVWNQKEIDELSWTSSNPDVALISPDGLAYGIKEGSVTFTAADSKGTYKDSISMTVTGNLYHQSGQKVSVYENIPISYSSIYDNCLQIPVDKLCGIYFMNKNELSFYSLTDKTATMIYQFKNCKDAFDIGGKLYLIDGSELVVIDLDTMQKKTKEIDEDWSLTSIAADTKGNVVCYGKIGSNNYMFTFDPSLELTGQYPSSQSVNNIGYYSEQKGLIIEEADYNWVYWGYNHTGNGLYKAEIKAGKMKENHISVSVQLNALMTQNGALLLFQDSYLAHRYNIEPIDDRYFSVVSSTFGTAIIFDTENDMEIVKSTGRSVREYMSDDSSSYQDRSTIGTRVVKNTDRDSFLIYETGNRIVEYSRDGSQLTTYNTKQNVFNLRKMGSQLIVFEKDGSSWSMEVIDYSDPESLEITQKDNFHTMTVGESLELGININTAYDCSYSWSSSDKKVATVSSSGVVTAWKSGEVIITVRTGTGISANYKIKVTDREGRQNPGDVIELCADTITDNISDENYTVYGKVVNSYLYTDSQNHMVRVEKVSDGVLVEEYDESMKLLSRKKIETELTIFGGFYAGTDANYLAFGDKNPNESNSKEVLRIVKYSKSWERQAAFSAEGINTYIPFDAGSLRMKEKNGVLYVHTCHEQYADSNGVHHQSNMTFAIRTDIMEEVSSYYDVMNLDYGYVSHSFNQFIEADDKYVYRLDHGDYAPRGIALTRFKIGDKVTDVGYVVPMGFGEGDSNATGASIGGLELTNDACFIVGNTVDQSADPYKYCGQRDVFVLILNKKNLSRKALVPLTSYTEEEKITPLTPHIVRVNKESVLVMWEEYHEAEDSYTTRFALVDSNGDLISQAANRMRLSDCKPVMGKDHKVHWYVTDGKKMNFYELDPLDLDKINEFSEESTRSVHNYDEGRVTKEATCTEKGSIIYRCLDCGKEEARELPPKGHHLIHIEQKSPTCTEDGNKAYYQCDVCGSCFDDAEGLTAVSKESMVLDKLGHDFHDGTCSRCGEKQIFKDAGLVYTVIKASGGRYEVEVAADKNADSLARGGAAIDSDGKLVLPGEVSFGGVSYTVTTVGVDGFSGHQEVSSVVLPASIGEVKDQAFAGCSNLEIVLMEAMKAPEIGKNVFQNTPSDMDVCALPGSVGYDKISNLLSLHVHMVSVKEGIPATCTEKGMTEGLYCTICNKTVQEPEEIPAKGHNSVVDPAVAATRTSTGLTQGSHCSVCGQTLIEQKIIPRLADPEGDRGDPAKPETVAGTENLIKAISNDGELGGSKFSLLQLKARKTGKTSISLGWNRVSGASGYIVYGNQCGRAFRFKLLAHVRGTAWKHNNLKKGTYYKYIVVAYRIKDGTQRVMASSKTIHVATSGGKVGNYKTVKVNKKSVKLKRKKTFKIKAKAKNASKKMKVKKHRGLCYESSDPSIATVSGRGKVKGKKKGSCFIYVYSQSGVFAKVKIIVK